MTDKKHGILVVDDEPNNLQLMMQILNEHYQVAFAANGAKALEIVNKIKPDIILLDIMMPGMDGYEVCKRLKEDELTATIPVIFVTAKGETDDEAKGLRLGAIDYITKPVSPAIVRARVENHLALKIAREQIEKKNRKLEAQNKELSEAARLREDVERITRHDLKTPLNAIISLPRLIKNGTAPENHMKFLELIEDSGLTMLNMINRSLDLFKMERQIYPFQPQSVNVLAIIDKILNGTEYFISKKDIAWSIMINGKPVEGSDTFCVHGEELLCYSMLSNLIKNSAEACPEGSRITVFLDHEDGVSVIRIYNTGAVPEEIRNKFFKKYVTSGKSMGTGLGTYSAKLIAETQGGSIHLDCSEEKGTTVTVRLPGENESEERMPSPGDFSLASIPSELISRLEKATLGRHMHTIRELIIEMRLFNSEVADTVATFADGFEYDRILELIQGEKDK